MEITEVRISLKEKERSRLKAFTTITFDNCFVVRDIKVIDGSKGLFVAMPSKKIRVPCLQCNFRNEIGSKYCGQCGARLETALEPRTGDENVRQEEHRDIAHPITMEFRNYIQNKVLEVYEKEKKVPQGEALPAA
ncbi:MAG: septation protein SpoVG family protein [Candidatus Omnitrophica bacterium]|nr:septation protein SpoVG family protein [Candidatus Omnitrophota bacterium]